MWAILRHNKLCVTTTIKSNKQELNEMNYLIWLENNNALIIRLIGFDFEWITNSKTKLFTIFGIVYIWKQLYTNIYITSVEFLRKTLLGHKLLYSWNLFATYIPRKHILCRYIHVQYT
jgi:hypothetical protein